MAALASKGLPVTDADSAALPAEEILAGGRVHVSEVPVFDTLASKGLLQTSQTPE